MEVKNYTEESISFEPITKEKIIRQIEEKKCAFHSGMIVKYYVETRVVDGQTIKLVYFQKKCLFKIKCDTVELLPIEQGYPLYLRFKVGKKTNEHMGFRLVICNLTNEPKISYSSKEYDDICVAKGKNHLIIPIGIDANGKQDIFDSNNAKIATLRLDLLEYDKTANIYIGWKKINEELAQLVVIDTYGRILFNDNTTYLINYSVRLLVVDNQIIIICLFKKIDGEIRPLVVTPNTMNIGDIFSEFIIYENNLIKHKLANDENTCGLSRLVLDLQGRATLDNIIPAKYKNITLVADKEMALIERPARDGSNHSFFGIAYIEPNEMKGQFFLEPFYAKIDVFDDGDNWCFRTQRTIITTKCISNHLLKKRTIGKSI